MIQIDEDGVIHTRVPFIRTTFNYDMDAASEEHGQANHEPTMTQQQFKEETDINTIVERFGVTGQLPEQVRVPQEGDFTGVTDFQSALNIVREAQEAFMEMPANVRERFNNDPGKFVDWSNDPENRAEAKKLGILAPEKQPERATLVRMEKDPEPAAGKEPAKPA